MGNHSSRGVVAAALVQPTRNTTESRIVPSWSCFEWGLPLFELLQKDLLLKQIFHPVDKIHHFAAEYFL